jgi:hypothetical protein
MTAPSRNFRPSQLWAVTSITEVLELLLAFIAAGSTSPHHHIAAPFFFSPVLPRLAYFFFLFRAEPVTSAPHYLLCVLNAFLYELLHTPVEHLIQGAFFVSGEVR